MNRRYVFIKKNVLKDIDRSDLPNETKTIAQSAVFHIYNSKIANTNNSQELYNSLIEWLDNNPFVNHGQNRIPGYPSSSYAAYLKEITNDIYKTIWESHKKNIQKCNIIKL